MIEFNGVSDEIARMKILIVVRKNKRTKPKLWKIVGKSDVFKDSFICEAEGELLNHFDAGELRLASNIEIQTGRRIDHKEEPK